MADKGSVAKWDKSMMKIKWTMQSQKEEQKKRIINERSNIT